MDMTLITLFLVAALAFANGTNDVSKTIATLVGSGVTNYRTAFMWGTAWTVVGAGASASLATAMVKTFSTGLIQPGLVIRPEVGLSVLAGSTLWVLLASRTGLPVSTTHALTGAIVGAGLMAFGSSGLLWSAIASKIALPLLVSPILALVVAALIHPVIRTMSGRWEGTCVCLMPTYRAVVTVDPHGLTRTLFQASGFRQPVADVPAQCDRAGLRGLSIGPDTLHWISSGLASFARGMNDAPKIVALLLLGGMTASTTGWNLQDTAFTAVALAMGLGSLMGGFRVTKVLAEEVTQMDHSEGLSANLTTSSLVLVSATMGLPVSTTHVSSSSIIGIGLLKGFGSVRWSTVQDMVLAWIVTLPATGILASLVYLALTGSI